MEPLRDQPRGIQRHLLAGRGGGDLRAGTAKGAAMSWKPGDRREGHDAMVRVDQAGEYGATRIYAGQLAVMGDRTPMARMINGMANQEERHRAFFDAMIARRGV